MTDSSVRSTRYHPVTPAAEIFKTGGVFVHPEVHDRICAIIDRPSAALAHRLEVERMLTSAMALSPSPGLRESLPLSDERPS